MIVHVEKLPAPPPLCPDHKVVLVGDLYVATIPVKGGGRETVAEIPILRCWVRGCNHREVLNSDE